MVMPPTGKEREVLVFHSEPFTAFGVLLVSALFSLICGVLWWITFHDAAGSWFSLRNCSAALTLGFALLSFRSFFLIRRPVPRIVLDSEALTVNGLFKILGSAVYRWQEIDSAPQVRCYYKSAHGPPIDLLYLHFFDDRWESIVDGTVSASLETLQIEILDFLDRYTRFPLRSARPVSTPPPDSARASLGRSATPTTPEAYALRFVLDPPRMPAARAMQMCFPALDEKRIEALLAAAARLHQASAALYQRVDSNELGWDDAVGILLREHGDFPRDVCVRALGSQRYYLR